MTCFKRSIAFSFFYSLVHLCCNQCNAGPFSNFNGFILDRLGKGKDGKSVDLEESVNPLDVVAELTSKNVVLTEQVTSLKKIIFVQKKHINDIRKEKEVLRREMSSQLLEFREHQETDREIIKNELRGAFEQEKNVILSSVEEDKKIVKEEHQIELNEIKIELTRDVEIKNAELETAVGITNILKEKIAEYEIDQAKSEKAQVDASKDIAELKRELRNKETASEKLRANNVDIKTTNNLTTKEVRPKKVPLINPKPNSSESKDSAQISQNIQQKEVGSKNISQPPRRVKPSTKSSSNSNSNSNRLPLKGGSKSPNSQNGL